MATWRYHRREAAGGVDKARHRSVSISPQLGAFSKSGGNYLLHRANRRATERFAKELGYNDLTARQLAVLATIDANEGLSQTGIVGATGIDRSTLADIVRRLVKRGLLTRRRSKTDSRAYEVRLTEAGRKFLESASPILARVEADMLAVLPVKRRPELLAALGTLTTD